MLPNQIHSAVPSVFTASSGRKFRISLRRVARFLAVVCANIMNVLLLSVAAPNTRQLSAARELQWFETSPPPPFQGELGRGTATYAAYW